MQKVGSHLKMGFWSMIVIRRNELIYYFKKESVTLEYRKQYISFNCYALQNRKKFRDFVHILQASDNSEYSNINDIYGLARRCEIRPVMGYKPTILDTVAF